MARAQEPPDPQPTEDEPFPTDTNRFEVEPVLDYTVRRVARIRWQLG